MNMKANPGLKFRPSGRGCSTCQIQCLIDFQLSRPTQISTIWRFEVNEKFVQYNARVHA